VESVKSISDLAAPLSGEVVEINAELSRQPDLVNRDPYGDGWMVVIRLTSPAEADRLLTAEEYRYLVEMSSA
jgi:glycine cleavage system H protein